MRVVDKKYMAAVSIAAAVMMGMTSGNAAASEQGYSDRDLMVATQIAYYNFSGEQLERHGGSAAIRDLLEESGVFMELQSDWNHADTELKKQMAQKSMDLFHEMTASDSPYGNWRLVDVKDHNQATGFYGILLETDPQRAIVGFRGSESNDRNQLIKDWMSADLGLLMNRDTAQQNEAKDFLTEISQKFSYSQYAAAGHSLGGNLAEHAAVTAPDDMRPKLVQTINFDGPGYSAVYMERHAEDIGKVPYAVSHYRWSLVGALLTQPSCASTRIIQVTEDIRNSTDVESTYMRHSTAFIDFRGDWVQDGREDLLSISMGRWSRTVDEQTINHRRKKLEEG